MATTETHHGETTFDLLGLTVEETQVISSVLGALNRTGDVDTYDLYYVVSDALEDAGEKSNRVFVSNGSGGLKRNPNGGF